jgi:hypothetical protein
LLTGAIGALVTGIFSIPMRLMTAGAGAGILEQLQSTMDQLPNLPPETRQMIESFAARGDMGAALMIVGFLFTLVVFSLFAMIGGAIGVAIFEKRKPGSAPPDIAQYQPPPPPPDVV